MKAIYVIPFLCAVFSGLVWTWGYQVGLHERPAAQVNWCSDGYCQLLSTPWTPGDKVPEGLTKATH